MRSCVKQVFAPGCALMLYKPELGRKISTFLNQSGAVIPEHHICCRHDPQLASATQVINVCAGCDRRFRSLYEGISTISLWEVLAHSPDFPFPDYHGQRMTVHDACPTRTEARVHDAVRSLLRRMNITVIEPEHTRTAAICCGDSSYGAIPTAAVKEQMKNRASQMPVEDVVVYCVSCVKSLHIGGKTPRYLLDLLFSEPTTTEPFEPDEWHLVLQAYIDAH
jgi:hypothetical protein